jgi:hypothetical protein
MAFGVGQDDIEGSFSNWFPDMKPDQIEELLEKLNEYKLIKEPKYGFHIDGGGEFTIYSGDPEDPDEFLYEGHIHGFIYDLMKYFNVRNDI